MRLVIALLVLGFALTTSADNGYDMINAKQLNDTTYVGGQPSVSDLDKLKANGVTTVISLRAEDENTGFNEAEELKKRGIHFVQIPIHGKADISFENAARLKAAMAEISGTTLVHCGSSNRVGALLALSAAAEGKSKEEALAEGKSAGLSSLTPVVEALLESNAKK